MGDLSAFDYRMFEEANKMAHKSDFDVFKVGCVFVYKHRILAKSCNSSRTDPLQKRYNFFRNFIPSSKPIEHSLHAEIACYKSLDFTTIKSTDWSKVSVYVYRWSKGLEGGKGMSRPCPACARFLRDIGIRDVYYTTDNGFAYERWD